MIKFINENSVIFTIVLAFCGLLLGAVKLWLKKRILIKVFSSVSVISTEISSAVYITAENHSEVPVYIEKPAFEIVRTKKRMYIAGIIPPINYPYLLNPGQKIIIHIPIDKIITQLVNSGYSNNTEIRAIYRTATNKYFRCKSTLTLLDLKKFHKRMLGGKVSSGVPNGIY
jgi:hypothetical protein